MFKPINKDIVLLCSLFLMGCIFLFPSIGLAKQQTVLLDANGQPLSNEMLKLLSSGVSRPIATSFAPKKANVTSLKNIPEQVKKRSKKTGKNLKKTYPNSRLDLEKDLLNSLKEGRTARAMSLVKSGVNPNYQNYKGETPLAVAVKKAWATMVRELSENGADIHRKRPNGVTLLHDASSRGLTDVAKVLMKYGLSPAKQTDKNWTSLHVAARYGHWELVRIFVQMGVDPNIRNSDGKTALELARHLRHQGVVKILARVTTARPFPKLLSKKRKRSKKKSSKRRKKKNKS